MVNEVYFSGNIERVIYSNKDNNFHILSLEIENTNSGYKDMSIVVTGNVIDIQEGDAYTFWGNMKQHQKFGEQLEISRYEKNQMSKEGLVNYFSSDKFKGIGKKRALQIIELYGNGDNTIKKILDEPEKLGTISGFTKEKRIIFLGQLKQNFASEQILSKLFSYGLSPKIATKIYEKYELDSVTIIKENPFVIMEEVKGVGFKVVDHLAERVGISPESPVRLQAAILHTVQEISIRTGNTYVEANELLQESSSILRNSRPTQLNNELLESQLKELIQSEKIIQVDNKIFDTSLFYSEQSIANNIQRLLDIEFKTDSEEELLKAIDEAEEELKMTYDKVQKEAIYKALKSKVFILTGGPGTGKTTVLKGIIKAYEKIHGLNLVGMSEPPVMLAAPTGRAAKRMNELTHLPSATIHRHLGIFGDDDIPLIDELECDLIIIDEFSMVDTWLAKKLFESISNRTQVIIVGDQDQLPSVGPGQVLADLLEVNDIPKTCLVKTFRQSDDSTIVELATQMKNGELKSDFTDKKADRSFIEASSNKIPELMSKIVQLALKNGISSNDIQVLAPMYKGDAGIDNLNNVLQNLLNPKKSDTTEFLYNKTVFREGDRVLHLVNNAELNVFNGDTGVITELIPSKYTESKQDELRIVFDGGEVLYPRNEWIKITLAYAMSIHKSQGSEFPVVILPVTSQAYVMLQRNLIYTAVTRAKSKLVMLGEFRAFKRAIESRSVRRKTYLIERFSEHKNKSKVEN